MMLATALLFFVFLLFGCKTSEPTIHDVDSFGEAHKIGVARVGPSRLAHLVRVVDGDTLVVKDGLSTDEKPITVRVLGIDCPESHSNQKCKKEGASGGETCAVQIPKGLVAAGEMKKRLGNGQLALEEVRGPDLYGRTLAYVRSVESGQDVGLQLVAGGSCREYAKYPHPRATAYKTAEPKKL